MELQRHFPEILRIAAILNPTERLTNELHLDGNRTIYVDEARLISFLKEALNVNLQLLHPSDGPFGSPLPDGNWTGIVGMVQREEADIAIGYLSVTTERLKVVDYSFPYRYSSETFVTDKPEHLRSNYALLHPFSPPVWVALFAAVVIVQLVFYVIKSKRENSQSALLKIWSSLLGMSAAIKLSRLRTKFLIASWFLGASLIAYCYRAFLLSSLTFPSAVGIKNIPELAKASESSLFMCSSYPGDFIYPALLNSKQDSLRKVGECLTRSNAFTKEATSFLRSRKYKKAFIGPLSSLKSFQNAYFVSEDTFFNNIEAIAVRKTFCCIDVLNKVILEAAAVGLFDKFEREVEMFNKLKHNFKAVEEMDPNRSLSLDDFSEVFILLGIGYILSCAAFLLELLLRRMER